MLQRSNNSLPAFVSLPKIFHNACCFLSFSGSTYPGSIRQKYNSNLKPEITFSKWRTFPFLTQNLERQIWSIIELMYSNNNYINLLQILQADISQVENKFLKWKLAISQLPNPSVLPQQQIVAEICSKLDAIHTTNRQFCFKFEEEFKQMHVRVQQLVQSSPKRHNERPSWNEDQKYQIITEKIASLEGSLKRTQDNESKLIETINTLMQKYQIHEQPTFIKNDQYLRSKIQESQVTPSFLNFQPCGTVPVPKRQAKDLMGRTIRKNDSNIYLLESDYFQGVTTSQTNTLGIEQPQYMRTFSKNGQKYSLKQNQPSQTQLNFPAYNMDRIRMSRQELNGQSKPSSVDRHQHRFKFMMQNLHQ